MKFTVQYGYNGDMCQQETSDLKTLENERATITRLFPFFLLAN